jgi:hypothetical protein
MRGLAYILLLPLTVPGALIGIVYALVTRRHPSAKPLMLFGAIGLGLLLAALSLLWAGVGAKLRA